jgi:hypothetical protein
VAPITICKLLSNPGQSVRRPALLHRNRASGLHPHRFAVQARQPPSENGRTRRVSKVLPLSQPDNDFASSKFTIIGVR